MYSGEMHIVQTKMEQNPFYWVQGAQYSVSHDTLQEIADIWGDGWFVRDFQEGDDVDFRYYGTGLRTAQAPQYMHLLGHSKYEWGLYFYGDTLTLSLNMINLKTGESKELYATILLQSGRIVLYNMTANTKGLGTTTTIRLAISIFREMQTLDEKLVVFKLDRPNYTGALNDFFASLDGAWAYDFNSSDYTVKTFTRSTNTYKYVLINAMLNYPNHLFESVGDIKFSLLSPSVIDKPRVVRVQEVNYLIAQDSLSSDNIFNNVVLPHPEGPRIATNSFLLKFMEMPLRALTVG